MKNARQPRMSAIASLDDRNREIYQPALGRQRSDGAGISMTAISLLRRPTVLLIVHSRLGEEIQCESAPTLM